MGECPEFQLNIERALVLFYGESRERGGSSVRKLIIKRSFMLVRLSCANFYFFVKENVQLWAPSARDRTAGGICVEIEA
jgi:hypothetical protein